MRLAASEAKHMIKMLELSVPLPDLWGEEKTQRLNQSPTASDLTKHIYMMKPPKATKDEIQQASGLVNTVEMGDSAHLERHGSSKWALPIPCPTLSPI